MIGLIFGDKGTAKGGINLKGMHSGEKAGVRPAFSLPKQQSKA